MRFKAAVAVLVLFAVQANAFDKQTQNTNSAGTILCRETSGEFDETVLAVVTVNLNSKGRAEAVRLQRPANEDLAAIDVTFNSKNSHIVHQVFATGDDPEKNICISDAQGCAKEVEKVVVKGNDGSSMELRVNDHQYGGVKGSSFAITTSNLKFDSKDSASLMNCAGPVMFPDQFLMMDLDEAVLE